MTRKAVTKPQKPRDDRAEYKRFLETARNVGASDDPKDFESAFNKVVSRKKPKPNTR